MHKLTTGRIIPVIIQKQEQFMKKTYLEPTEQAAQALFTSGIEGEVVMLNLLRFKETADYSAHPELAPDQPISGQQAYQKYMEFTTPFLQQSGGKLIFSGQASHFFIGPENQRWDLVIMVQQKSLADFMAFASNPDYLAGLGHRTAALEDSRLLPITELRP